jgi:hypothetical protein
VDLLEKLNSVKPGVKRNGVKKSDSVFWGIYICFRKMSNPLTGCCILGTFFPMDGLQTSLLKGLVDFKISWRLTAGHMDVAVVMAIWMRISVKRVSKFASVARLAEPFLVVSLEHSGESTAWS